MLLERGMRPWPAAGPFGTLLAGPLGPRAAGPAHRVMWLTGDHRVGDTPWKGAADGDRPGVRDGSGSWIGRRILRVPGDHVLLLLPGLPGGLQGRSGELH